MGTVDPARVRLGRIRCLTRSIECMKKGEPLPQALCFVPKELKFEYSEGKDPLVVYEETKDSSKVVNKLPEGKLAKFCCVGQPVYNAAGGWMKMVSPHDGWVLLHPTKKGFQGKLRLATPAKDEKKEPMNWLKAVEQICTLQIGKNPQIANCNEELTTKIQTPPPGWNIEADDELAQFLVQYGTNGGSLTIGGGGVQGSEYFTRVEASSEEDNVGELLEPDTEDHYWESDGNQGDHWLRFHMKPGTIVEKFALVVDPDDGSYLPRRVIIKAGSRGSLTTLYTRSFSMSDYSTKELHMLLHPLSIFYEIIEVHFKSCYQGGIDCRVRGVILTTHTSECVLMPSDSLSEEIFTPERISRFPKLQPFEPRKLFYRGLALKRVASLLDSDLTYLLPRSELGSSNKLNTISAIRQLWPLSNKRNNIITQLISDSSSSSPSRPILYINRMSAKEHCDDPSKDPQCRNTVFNQLIRELNKHTKPTKYNFRWAGHWSQWWECKFIQEGIIDQGGGFRDTIADIADELCPSEPNAEVALPLFIRSPNQSQDSSNVYRDAYVPNPGCNWFQKYRFIGQLMGAMFRSQESLVLSLPQFVWKQLVGDSVVWERDYISVDSAEVKLIDSIETMSRETFEAAFEGALKFTAVLSNGDTVSLQPDGDEERMVTYDNRLEYCKLVKTFRMKENKTQIEAIREGLVKVVPSEVLNIMTWQELEFKVCGNPEITIEALKKSTRYDSSLSETSPRVKMMWAALEKFSNEDRSRFLRFITGRRRLPCTVLVDEAESYSSKLPTSATCSNTIYLPTYSSVDEAVDKLRYAAYNCVAIDTDMSPWE